MSLTYEAFGALIGVSKQRVAQLIRMGRLVLPLTEEQAASYERGPAAPEPVVQQAILAALHTTDWRRASEIARRIGNTRKTVSILLLKLEARGLVERRPGPISAANHRPTVEWRRKQNSS